MTLSAHIGAAGVGKTHRLLEVLAGSEKANPLDEGQRVLALTFMHGSRQRLEHQLRGVPGLKGRYDCVVVDRFAWELCQRWRSLLRNLGQNIARENDFEGTCDAAGALLEQAQVAAWVARTYPKIVVDEAQDLTLPRLRIIRAIEHSVFMIAAADEFQCLQPELRPNPAMKWLRQRCEPTELTVQHRTSRPELISAAIAVREGKPLPILALVNDKEAFAKINKFSLAITPGRSPFVFASVCVSNAIHWNGGRTISIITPARGDFANKIVEQVGTTILGSKNTGPFPIEWDQSDETIAAETFAKLMLPTDGNVEETLRVLAGSDAHVALSLCRSSLARHRSLTGCVAFSPALVRECLSSAFSRQRRFGTRHGARVRAMTVHAAKNREFEGVIVLWPFNATGTPEHQRRLLYNAITRAQRWCTIVVQSRDMLTKPPFAADV